MDRIQVCPRCLKEVKETDTVCPHCGAPVVSQQPQQPQQSQPVGMQPGPQPVQQPLTPPVGQPIYTGPLPPITNRVDRADEADRANVRPAKQGGGGSLMWLWIMLAVIALAGIGYGAYYYINEANHKSSYVDDDDDDEYDDRDYAVDENDWAAEEAVEEAAEEPMSAYEEPEPEMAAVDEEPDYFYDIACERYLTDDDLRGLSKQELRIMRNWIFARHGYIFTTDEMRSFFNAMPWYVGRYNDVTSFLSRMELDNIDKIKQYE